MAFALLQIINILLNVAITVIIVQAIMSWLLAFNVINLQNDIARAVWTALDGLTAPIYNPIRKIMPDTRPLDLTPLVAFIIIISLQSYVLPVMFGYR